MSDRVNMGIREDEYIAGNPAFNGSDFLVVVSGCSSGGKSTLLSEMAARGYPIFPEPGRQIVKEQLYIGGDGLPWENPLKFVELCVSRSLYFYNTASPTQKPTLFDRSIVDNLDAFGRMGQPAPNYLIEAVQRYRYARRVFLVPPWKELFVNDAERRHSFEDAEAEYNSLITTYQVQGYEVVLVPRGPVADRADFLKVHLGF